jgi:hypothetical protein
MTVLLVRPAIAGHRRRDRRARRMADHLRGLAAAACSVSPRSGANETRVVQSRGTHPQLLPSYARLLRNPRFCRYSAPTRAQCALHLPGRLCFLLIGNRAAAKQASNLLSSPCQYCRHLCRRGARTPGRRIAGSASTGRPGWPCSRSRVDWRGRPDGPMLVIGAAVVLPLRPARGAMPRARRDGIRPRRPAADARQRPYDIADRAVRLASLGSARAIFFSG